MKTKAFVNQKLVKFYQLKEKRENLVCKCVVYVKKENEILGYLPLGKDGKFAKSAFYFLRTDDYGSCNVLIKGKTVNLGDGDGMQVSCLLNFVDRNEVYLYFVFYIVKNKFFYKTNWISPNKHSC